MPDDEKFNELIRHHAADYRADVPAPAEQIWGRIERDVADAVSTSRRSDPRRRVWLAAAAGLAAALILGVGIGRWTGTRAPANARVERVAATPGDSLRRLTHLRATAYDHLDETELFLTEVRADLRAGRNDTDRDARSRELLARTRLLLQSREQQPPSVTRLLEDIELLLAEIATLPDTGRRSRPTDAALLEESLTRNDIIPRIRTTVPVRGVGT
ncbi:MAG TPA: hypothetical protein VKA54_01120 [Gemmatimonadaceae bacterium]|nr:hypothetical protein [Gemmatimonadaceae bacterium]